MEQNYNFDEIRPYRDNEVHAVLVELLKEPQLLGILAHIFPETPIDLLVERLKSIRTVEEFQQEVILSFVNGIESKTSEGVTMLGTGNINPAKANLFISNHRDIVLDAAFLNTSFFKLGFPLTEIAIGDNLLIFKWITDLVKLNRSFIVRRNLPARQMLESSRLLSAYIRYTVSRSNRSVWIAQREGRAKDSNDRTQEALLKMLDMSGEGNFVDNMQELAICPLTISYEYDPCDYLKAKEFQQRRDNPDYKKSQQDDLLNMKTGIEGYKGRIEYFLNGNIDADIAALNTQDLDKAEQVKQLAALIDKKIHLNYTVYANNRISYDLLTGSNRFAGEYNVEEKLAFEAYLQRQIDKIVLPDKDEVFLRTKMLEMYSNPLKNKLIAEGK
ncbi:MAG: acyltransferase [Prevotellaceae bacterium]|jgi:hypothetical protein|nr:acyltransferase [Prevotellaceae bacterium]